MSEDGGLGRERLLILLGLMIAMLLGALDQTIVATALPTIASDLGGLDKLSWVVTAYLVTVTVTTPLYGKLSDMYGRRPLFQVAIGLFLLGSALSGLAGNMVQLALFRALQGLGGGGLMAMASTTLGDIFSPRERGEYMSYMMMIFGLATVVGPLLGGFLTDTFSWRWVFYINLPIGAVALTIVNRTLDLPVPEQRHRIDYEGAILLLLAVGSLILAMTWGGNEYAWTSPTIELLLEAGLVLSVLFLLQEHRVAEPIFPLRLLRNPVASTTMGLSFCLGFVMLGGLTYLPVFLQTVLGQSATNSGLLLLPLMGGMILTAGVTGQLITRTGRYKPFPVVGSFFVIDGWFLFSTMSPSTTMFRASVYMFVAGMGMGMIMPVLTIAIQNAVPRRDLGVATTSITFTRSLASATGVAVFGSIFNNALSANLPSFMSGGANAGAGMDASSINALPPALHAVVVGALSDAITTLFLWGVPVAVVALAIALLLPEYELGETAHVSFDEAAPAQGATPGSTDSTDRTFADGGAP